MRDLKNNLLKFWYLGRRYYFLVSSPQGKMVTNYILRHVIYIVPLRLVHPGLLCGLGFLIKGPWHSQMMSTKLNLDLVAWLCFSNQLDLTLQMWIFLMMFAKTWGLCGLTRTQHLLSEPGLMASHLPSPVWPLNFHSSLELAGGNWTQREMPLQLLIWRVGWCVPICFVCRGHSMVAGADHPLLVRFFDCRQ